ncbi:hypothetical protein [Enterococcus sp.]|uniref:hypothetical protein n=1 Tax=Enterococcus sp. TaxID=35783 RepID=UPI00289F1CA5|nr:hypothetical protein [Enterococcus sp.]
MTPKEKYKELYIQHIIKEDGSTTEEMRELFAIVLEEFGDDPEKMSEFIQSIVDENTEKKPTELDLLKQENNELKQRQEMAEEALLTLSDMLLSR